MNADGRLEWNGHVYKDIYKELEAIAMKDETLKTAFQGWELLSASQDEVLAYEARLKQVLDEEAARREAELRENEAREEGRQEGRQEGREEGVEVKALEIARKMLTKGFSAGDIREFTGLSLEKIQKLKDEGIR